MTAAHVCQTILPSLDGLLRALSIPPFWGHHSTSEALIRAALPLLERDTTACVERAIKAYRADANPFGGSSSIGQFLRDSFFVDNRVVTGSLRILRNTLLYVGGTSHRVFEKQWRTAAVDLADSHLEDRHPVRGCIDDVLEACSQQFGEAVGHLRTVSDDDENGETILAYYREIAELATVEQGGEWLLIILVISSISLSFSPAKPTCILIST